MATYMKVFNEAGIEMHGMPNDGQFYATSTMLGCVPGEDKNRRYVYCWPSDEPVLVMNKHMERWGKRDEEHLQVVLLALNSHAKTSTVIGSIGMTCVINVPGLNEVLEKGEEAIVHISKDRVASMVASGPGFGLDRTASPSKCQPRSRASSISIKQMDRKSDE
jgi:hypothetical protein